MHSIGQAKIPILAIFGAVLPHFLTHNDEIGHEVRAWDSLSETKFCKNDLRRYTPFGQTYQKLPILAIWGCKPTF